MAIAALVLAWIILGVSVLATLMLFYGAYGAIMGAPYVPSKDYKTDRMFDLAKIKPGEIVFDLGSGDGKLLLRAAKAGAHAHGWEVNPFLAFVGWMRAARQGLAVRSHWGNLSRAPFERADVVFIYLTPAPMPRLEKILQKSLRPGSRVVVNSFPFPNWQPTATRGHVYRYDV